MRYSNALLLVGLAVSWFEPAHAQRSGVNGTVYDTLGAVLPGVQVELSGTDFGAITSAKGEFRLTKLKPGPYTLFMRRIGFDALSMKLDVRGGDPMELEFELTPTQVRLATVTVKAAYVSNKLKQVGFENRLRTSGTSPSRFFTRADIEKRNPTSLTHLVERLGGRARNCLDGLVYIDGCPPTQPPDAPAPGGIFRANSALRGTGRADNNNNNNLKYRPLETIPVKVVEGMEVYAGLSEVPTEFRAGPHGQANGRCVILIWTRDR